MDNACDWAEDVYSQGSLGWRTMGEEEPGSSIVVLVTFSKYNLGMGKYKLSILLDECLVLFANFHTLLKFVSAVTLEIVKSLVE